VRLVQLILAFTQVSLQKQTNGFTDISNTTNSKEKYADSLIPNKNKDWIYIYIYIYMYVCMYPEVKICGY